ncbi:MAG: hypothetical protein WDA75_19120 [Candidatus Latescibacterota bacterium]|jgi:hypothetical protein
MFKKILPSIIYAVPFPFFFWMMIEVWHDVFARVLYVSGEYSTNTHPLFPVLQSIGRIFHMNEFDVLRLFPIVFLGSLIFLVANLILARVEKTYHSVLHTHIEQSIFYYGLLILMMLLLMIGFHGLFLDTAIPIVAVAIVVNVFFVYRNSKIFTINDSNSRA